MLKRHRREASIALVIAALGIVLAAVAPGYFAHDNLRRSVPRQHAGADRGTRRHARHPDRQHRYLRRIDVRDLRRGRRRARQGWCADDRSSPWPHVSRVRRWAASTARWSRTLRIPSVVVTLATMVALRDALRWTTQGAWVQDLPAGFQWFGLAQATYPFVACAIVVVLQAGLGWGMRNLAAGRAVYATGSNEHAARLAGFDTAAHQVMVFAVAGALTGLAALLNSVRFNQIPSNAGHRPRDESDRRGGRRRRRGARRAGERHGHAARRRAPWRDRPGADVSRRECYWERALQGSIILAAVAIDAVRDTAARRAIGDAGGGRGMIQAWRRRWFPNGEWIVLLALAGEIALFAAIAPQFLHHRQLLRGHPAQRGAWSARGGADAGRDRRRDRPVGRLDDGPRGCRIRRARTVTGTVRCRGRRRWRCSSAAPAAS